MGWGDYAQQQPFQQQPYTQQGRPPAGGQIPAAPGEASVRQRQHIVQRPVGFYNGGNVTSVGQRALPVDGAWNSSSGVMFTPQRDHPIIDVEALRKECPDVNSEKFDVLEFFINKGDKFFAIMTVQQIKMAQKLHRISKQEFHPKTGKQKLYDLTPSDQTSNPALIGLKRKRSADEGDLPLSKKMKISHLKTLKEGGYSAAHKVKVHVKGLFKSFKAVLLVEHSPKKVEVGEAVSGAREMRRVIDSVGGKFKSKPNWLPGIFAVSVIRSTSKSDNVKYGYAILEEKLDKPPARKRSLKKRVAFCKKLQRQKREMHNHSIFHGDVKLDNIMSRRGKDPVMIDWDPSFMLDLDKESPDMIRSFLYKTGESPLNVPPGLDEAILAVRELPDDQIKDGCYKLLKAKDDYGYATAMIEILSGKDCKGELKERLRGLSDDDFNNSQIRAPIVRDFWIEKLKHLENKYGKNSEVRPLLEVIASKYLRSLTPKKIQAMSKISSRVVHQKASQDGGQVVRVRQLPVRDPVAARFGAVALSRFPEPRRAPPSPPPQQTDGQGGGVSPSLGTTRSASPYDTVPKFKENAYDKVIDNRTSRGEAAPVDSIRNWKSRLGAKERSFYDQLDASTQLEFSRMSQNVNRDKFLEHLMNLATKPKASPRARFGSLPKPPGDQKASLYLVPPQVNQVTDQMRRALGTVVERKFVQGNWARPNTSDVPAVHHQIAYSRRIQDEAVGKPHKDRYKNVLPFDKTRVVLPSDPTLYLNANLVGKNQNLVIMQGPMEHTAQDTKRMVQELGIKRVVTLGSPVENGVAKFHDVQYPNEVKHSRFAEWQDMERIDVGQVKSEIRDLLEEMATGEKIAIHCSAGAGRTGVMAGVLMTMEKLMGNENLSVDQVYQQFEETALELRDPEKGRSRQMIQTEDQFKMGAELVLELAYEMGIMNLPEH